MIDILKQINGAAMRGNPRMMQIKNIMNTIRSARNPQAALMGMMQNNPQMKQVMDLVNQYGGDPDKALRAVADMHGINPQDIYDMLK